MRKTLLIFTGLLPLLLFGQNQGAWDDGVREYNTPSERLSVAVSPLALLDVYSGSAYKAGISMRPFLWLRVTADAGGYLPAVTEVFTTFSNMKGYHFRGSIGWVDYFNQFGLGLSYQYKKQDFNFTATSVSDSLEYTGHVSKFAHCFNVTGNINLPISQRLFVEIRADLGVRYRDIFNTQSDLVDNSYDWQDSWFSERIKNKQAFMPNIAVAVRLNYTLWKAN